VVTLSEEGRLIEIIFLISAETIFSTNNEKSTQRVGFLRLMIAANIYSIILGNFFSFILLKLSILVDGPKIYFISANF
jgi:hypothetical protein